MNILITTFSFPYKKGNIHDGNFVFAEAMAYAEGGADVRVLTPHIPGTEKLERIHDRLVVMRFQYFFPQSRQVAKKAGIPLYGRKSFWPIIQMPILCICFLIQILKCAHWADIIHAQWTVSALLALSAKWLYKTPLVLTARGSDLRLVPQWMNRFIHSHADAAIDCFGPQPWNNAYKKAFPARYLTLPLLVYTNDSISVPEEMENTAACFTILYVGRFDWGKIRTNTLPLFDLVQASKILRSKGMAFKVFYVGDGDSAVKKRLSDLILELDLFENIILLGTKTNVIQYIEQCDLGVGGIAFNAVSQEFTICGKPQILVDSADNAGTPWQHGINALFFKPGDPMDLAHKLAWAINHREETQRLGKRAKQDMEAYILNSKQGGKIYIEAFQGLLTRLSTRS
jgi:glycosyltransferase involved in cell wall biosynthesis